MAHREPPTDLSAGSEEMFDFFCQPCSPDKHMEAVVYCQDCSEYLCITCADYHGKLSATKHHKMLGKSSMHKTPPKIQHTDVIKEKCLEHPDEVLEYFCKTHNQLGCRVCIALDHSSCSDKSYIPDVSNAIHISQEYKSLKADLDRLLWQITKLQKDASDASKNNEKKHSEALADIREFRKQVNKLLDKIEADTRRKLNRLRQEITGAIKKASDKYQSLSSEVKSMSEDMDKTAKAGKNNQLFVQVKMAYNRIADVQKRLKDETDKCKVMRYAFDKDEKLQQMMSTLSDLWSLSVRQDDTPSKARYVREINVKTNDDAMTCCITGIAVLAKDCVVVADCNNKVVKLYDTKVNKLLSRLSLSLIPCDITAIKAKQVAVALGIAMEIQIISVSGGLKLSQTIKTPDAAIAGLCYNGSNFITACQLPGSVKIIDMSGNTLSTFSIGNNNEQLFVEPRYIALSRGNDVVYITDHTANTVTSLSLSGQVIWAYRHDKLKGAKGVTIGKDGTVYVCGKDTDTVHQLTSTGNLTKIILRRDQGLIQCPYAITYCYEGAMLYISSFNSKAEESNYIRLFQLE